MNAADEGHNTLALIPAYNEQGKIEKTVSSIPAGVVSRILVIDDGSTDGTAGEAAGAGAAVIRNSSRQGVGKVICQAIKYGRENGFSILVVMGGNSKDNGREIPRLTTPIINQGYDFVQGSRFLKGGSYGNIPFHRIIATRFIHPTLFSFFAGRRMTDTTNGFRAIRLSIFDDKRINIAQEWLAKYELEPYIYFKCVQLGYKVLEVPVSKIYPSRLLGYSKMRPILDWWSILRPLFLLGLGIKD